MPATAAGTLYEPSDALGRTVVIIAPLPGLLFCLQTCMILRYDLFIVVEPARSVSATRTLCNY